MAPSATGSSGPSTGARRRNSASWSACSEPKHSCVHAVTLSSSLPVYSEHGVRIRIGLWLTQYELSLILFNPIPSFVSHPHRFVSAVPVFNIVEGHETFLPKPAET